jgi:hypothetical protein
MATITFIYRLYNQSKAFYGKVNLSVLSDNHEGLDNVVRAILLEGINAYRAMKKMSALPEDAKLQVGVLSRLTLPNDYSSDQEESCFDFYAKQQEGSTIYYVNGRKIE